MNEREKVKVSIRRFIEVCGKVDALEKELQVARGGIVPAKEELKRVLHAVYGEGEREVLYRENGVLYRFGVDREGKLRIAEMQAELLE